MTLPGGFGRPSSVIDPASAAADDSAIVWFGPALTTGAWLPPLPVVTVTAMSACVDNAPSLAVTRRTQLPATGNATLVIALAGCVNIALAGPATCVQAIASAAGGSGNPSSAMIGAIVSTADPLAGSGSVAVGGRLVIVGAWLPAAVSRRTSASMRSAIRSPATRANSATRSAFGAALPLPSEISGALDDQSKSLCGPATAWTSSSSVLVAASVASSTRAASARAAARRARGRRSAAAPRAAHARPSSISAGPASAGIGAAAPAGGAAASVSVTSGTSASVEPSAAVDATPTRIAFVPGGSAASA